jgi:hypothetical protein
MKSPEEMAKMAKIIREQHNEIEYLERQHEILTLVLLTVESRFC